MPERLILYGEKRRQRLYPVLAISYSPLLLQICIEMRTRNAEIKSAPMPNAAQAITNMEATETYYTILTSNRFHIDKHIASIHRIT